MDITLFLTHYFSDKIHPVLSLHFKKCFTFSPIKNKKNFIVNYEVTDEFKTKASLCLVGENAEYFLI
jgi:hypothetical protein